jgi:hypothetical protein
MIYPFNKGMRARAIALVAPVSGLDLVALILNAFILDEIYSHWDRGLDLRAPLRALSTCLHIGDPSALPTLPSGSLGMRGSRSPLLLTHS